MSNTLRSRSELRIAGILLSGLGLLGLTGCASDNETTSQPTVSASSSAESPTPEASVPTAEVSPTEATVTLSDGYVVSKEVVDLTDIASAQEAYDMIAYFDTLAANTGEEEYFDTKDILLTAITTGDLSPLVDKYAIDQEEIEIQKNKLISTITSQKDSVMSITVDQSTLLSNYVWYTPQDTLNKITATLLLLDIVTHLPNYNSVVPASLEECEGVVPLSTRMIAEPLGYLSFTKESAQCAPDSDRADKFINTYDPKEVKRQADSLLATIGADPNIWPETMVVLNDWFDAVASKHSTIVD